MIDNSLESKVEQYFEIAEARQIFLTPEGPERTNSFVRKIMSEGVREATERLSELAADPSVRDHLVSLRGLHKTASNPGSRNGVRSDEIGETSRESLDVLVDKNHNLEIEGVAIFTGKTVRGGREAIKGTELNRLRVAGLKILAGDPQREFHTFEIANRIMPPEEYGPYDRRLWSSKFRPFYQELSHPRTLLPIVNVLRIKATQIHYRLGAYDLRFHQTDELFNISSPDLYVLPDGRAVTGTKIVKTLNILPENPEEAITNEGFNPLQFYDPKDWEALTNKTKRSPLAVLVGAAREATKGSGLLIESVVTDETNPLTGKALIGYYKKTS